MGVGSAGGVPRGGAGGGIFTALAAPDAVTALRTARWAAPLSVPVTDSALADDTPAGLLATGSTLPDLPALPAVPAFPDAVPAPLPLALAAPRDRIDELAIFGPAGLALPADRAPGPVAPLRSEARRALPFFFLVDVAIPRTGGHPTVRRAAMSTETA